MLTKKIARGRAQTKNATLTRNLDGRIETIEVPQFITLGRGDQNGVVVDDPFVSLRHARIEKRDQGFFVRDLRSSNGLYVNGAQALEAKLNDGDYIQLGQTQFRFRYESTTANKNTLLNSHNSAFQDVLDRIPSIAQSELPIMILGPSGAGKEMIAQQIHRDSGRAQGPFVSVNCSALSESLIESELFGHLRGSFTGATGDRKGAFMAAQGGTLFLDEIGDLPLNLQPKLLRALENSEIKPVGCDRALAINVRVLTATHKNLKEALRVGEFREDLYFRLNVVPLQLPALKDRMEDFETLLYHFCRTYKVSFSVPAIDRLKKLQWPGNIRELKNLVARSSAVFPQKTIEEKQIEQLVEHMPSVRKANQLNEDLPVIKEVERELICKRLVANHGNQRQTAQDLGLPKSTLHDRIKTYNIDVKGLISKV